MPRVIKEEQIIKAATEKKTKARTPSSCPGHREFESTIRELQEKQSETKDVINKIADLIQEKIDPVVEVENGSVHQMLQSDAIRQVWNKVSEQGEKINSIDSRLQVLDDRTLILGEMQAFWNTLKSVRDKTTNLQGCLKLSGKGVVAFAAVILFFYALALLITGKMTLIQFLKDLF